MIFIDLEMQVLELM